MTSRVAIHLCVLALLLWTGAAGAVAPLSGDAFHAVVAAQDVELQRAIEALGVEALGCLVTGPLDIFYQGDDATRRLMSMPRVVCPDLDRLGRARDAIENAGGSDAITRVKCTSHLDAPLEDGSGGFRGVAVTLRLHGEVRELLIMTLQQTRWLLWMRDVAAMADSLDRKQFDPYARAVSDYLHGVDRAGGDGEMPAPPAASAFGLPAAVDLYPPRPDYIIAGYDEFMATMRSYAGIECEIARGVDGFVPGDSLREAMIDGAPPEAWPNREEVVIQYEYRAFFERGGDAGAITTLSAAALDTLAPGEYVFAVGLSGKVRFAPERRLEGPNAARINHAFLFPGEAVLTAGMFLVAETRPGVRRIIQVDAQSGHYFYSNLSRSIRDDLALNSNRYMLTLGHFLAALDDLGIGARGMVIRKL